ncbi:TPA: hypothetical protein ON523_000189 [Morganella morganii]|nr:hypothetical protein [Morganella morganii]
MSVKITITITEDDEGKVGFRVSGRGAAGKHTHTEAQAAGQLVKIVAGYLKFLKSEGHTGSDENCEYMYPNQVKH